MMTDEQLDQIIQKYNLKPYDSQNTGINKTSGLRGRALLDSLESTSNNTPNQFSSGFGGFNNETPPPEPKKEGFLSRVGSNIKERLSDIGDTFGETYRGEINPLETGIRTAGAAAGAVGDVVGEGIMSAGSKIKEWAPESIKQILRPTYHAALDAIGKGAEHYSAWAEENPRVAKDLEATFNIASLLPIGKGAQVASEIGEQATKGVVKQAVKLPGVRQAAEAVASRSERKLLDKAAEAAMPVLKKSEKVQAIASGKAETGSLLKESKITPDVRDFERAKAIKEVYNPKVSNIENVQNIDKGIESSARQLRSNIKDYDVGYSLDNLKKYLLNLKSSPERQLTFAGDQAAEHAYDRAVDVFMKTAEKNPNLLSGILDTRKEFDQIAKRSLSGAFEKDRPLTIAFRDIRRGANDFITEHTPEGAQVRELLKKQNLMYEARDAMAEKAVKEELGKTGLKKFAQKNPKIKKAAEYTGAAILGKELYDLAK